MMKPNLLNRYILGEFFPPFLLGLLVCTFVLLINHIFYMIDLFLNRGVDPTMILKMATLVIPMILPISVPLAALLAALLSYGRLSEDGEITALRSSGCAHHQYTFPVIFVSLIFGVALIFFNLNISPHATFQFKELQFTLAQKNPLALFSAKVMNHFGEYKVIVDKIDRGRKNIEGVSIYRMNSDGSPTKIIAPEGELEKDSDGDLSIVLLNGSLHQPNQDKENEYTITKFNRFVLRIPTKMDGEKRVPTIKEMTYGELEFKAASARDAKDVAPVRTEIHSRVAASFAPFVFVLLGTLLGTRVKRGAKAIGVGLSLVIILVYYGLSLFSISLSNQSVFHPFFLTWIPNGAGLIAAGAIWMHGQRQ